MKKIGILGSGTWGIALARMLAIGGHEVTVWSALPNEIETLRTTRRQKYLPDVQIPEQIVFTESIQTACAEKDILLFAVPSAFVRKTANTAKPYIQEEQIIVDVAKGIESDTLLTMSRVIKDEIGKSNPVVALSGPTHAEEVARDLPTAIVSACEDMEIARIVQDVFMNTCMRVYANPDVIGVELCGALKNIIALAAGISTGIGYGDNAKAALVTRGMSEIARLGKKMGGLEQTFFGLAGMGDLIVTTTSLHSRNNRCGILIGQGMSPADAEKQIGMVVEGLYALPAAIRLMKRYDVEMPIIQAVDEIVNAHANPTEMVNRLMNRDKKDEIVPHAAPLLS